MQMKHTRGYAVLAILVATAVWSGCSPKKVEPMKTVAIEDGTIDPAEWGKVYPLQYKLWRQTGEPTPAGKSKYKKGYDVGEDRRDKLDEYPFLALLYNGWGFGSEYREPRGHFFMVQDQLEVDPGRVKAGGSCLTCKTPYAPILEKQMGKAYFSTPYKEVLAKLPKDQQTLGVACIDCHDNRGMALKISRGFTLGKALKKIGADEEKLTAQEKRTLVCAQCHVSYMITKDKEMHSTDVVFPWQGSKVGNISIENIIAEIKSSPANLEWTQSVTGFKLGFIRHPEYELFSNNSPHWANGVSCADCHMPTVTRDGQKVSDHRIMSPLKNDLIACAACHTETSQVLRDKIFAIQDQTMIVYLKAGYATATDAKLFEIANKVEASGKKIDKALYAQAREQYEQAFYRLIFIGAENSNGFHNPTETMRVLNDAAKYAASADSQLRKLLAQAGEKVPEKIDLELSKYTNNRGVNKIMFRPEHEIKSPEVK
ncbi:ammonia-forming cytochrome c nitrite reductase subunit c552 [Geobacter sulfurreducens subsp. ethanolicus]|uniref:nitrite reductase (cytochrome; ammonia-forming) n=1 Tax=Geomobilimonas luticola TaxID=1114878 RepID=A0ABS5SEU3_9BACT|nr:MULTISPECIES: ammonia-forming cytochrome c nitrite reductase subunit c552 [Geobacteraceae]MBT0652527.1 ammonia-forming cytochrome c nitrite reductase subunit c552 [Geomobilimonas luticola]BEH08965.1 ammonia-forming cytochrome c nitrite reductase subunit c552 [Geobacter sulfurreducens subsp. ethanolicus]